MTPFFTLGGGFAFARRGFDLLWVWWMQRVGSRPRSNWMEAPRLGRVSKVLDGKGLTFHCFRLSVSFPCLHPLSPSPY